MHVFANELNNYFKEIGLEAEVTSIEDDVGKEADDGYTGYLSVYAKVSRKDYKKANKLYEFPKHLNNGYFSVRWEQIQPDLVEAKIGDFVLIYNKYKYEDKESDIGIVSSKISINNKIVYGCRYLILNLERHYKDICDFHITSEDYSGYHTGFLKVLSEEDSIKHLENRANKFREECINAIEAKYKRIFKLIPNFINGLVKSSKVTNVEKIYFDRSMEEHMNIEMPEEDFSYDKINYYTKGE